MLCFSIIVNRNVIRLLANVTESECRCQAEAEQNKTNLGGKLKMMAREWIYKWKTFSAYHYLTI